MRRGTRPPRSSTSSFSATNSPSSSRSAPMRALPEGRGATPFSRRVIGRALAGWAAAAALAGCGFAGIGGDRLTFEVHNESNVPVTLEVVDAGGANPAQGRSIGAPIVVAPGADDPVTIVAPTS